MLFASFVRSKLASLLRPWLEEEPEFELKLGFRRVIVSVKNLVFNPSSLNPFIEDSTRLVFESVKVEELSIRISPWSFPSLILDVRGVEVTVTPREPVQERRGARDFVARKRKELIAALDPEGVSLHEIIGKILVKGSSGNWLTKNLANVMLRSCHIQFTDIYIQLQLIDASHKFMLKVNDFSLESQFIDQISLFRGLAGLLFISGKETELAISCSCIESGQKENGHENLIASLMGLSVHVRLNDLQPLNYVVHIPHVNVKILPLTIPNLIILLHVLSFKEIRNSRTGKELWKIAAEKICPWVLTPKLSLHEAVNTVLLFLRYIHAYELLLAAIGYYDSKTLEENLAMVSNDNKRLKLVKHKWELVYDLEAKLPAEVVARARRIARKRASSHLNLPDLESKTGFTTTSLLKFVVFLLLFWKIFHFIFLSVVQLLSMKSISTARQRTLLEAASNNFKSEFQFSLSLGEVYITLSHANTHHAIISTKKSNKVYPPDLQFASFCFIIKFFCLDFTAGTATTLFFVALGELKLCLSLSSKDSLKRSDLRSERMPSFKGLKHEGGDASNVILWGDPACIYHPSEGTSANCSNTSNDVLVFNLENSIGDLQSNWIKLSRKYEGMNVKHKDKPFVLCELKNIFVDPYKTQGGHGLWKCSLVLGKLNISLGYSSILSSALLVKQMQCYHQLATSVGRKQIPCSSGILAESSKIGWEDGMEFYINTLKIAMHNSIPNKNIQIGVFIAGPSIRMSSHDILLGVMEQDFGSPIAQGSYHYCFDVKNIEFAVWPTSKSVVAPLTGQSIFNETTLEYLWQKDPRVVDIPKPHSNESFFCRERIALDACLKLNGLTVVVDDLEWNQQSSIIEPMSITLQWSTCRDCLHSLTTTENIFSMAVKAFTSEAAVFFYMDELWTFLQIFKGMFSVVLPTCACFETTTIGYSQDFFTKLATTAREDTERNMVKSEANTEAMIIKNTKFLIDATIELEVLDIVLNDSRRKASSGTSMNFNGASSSNTNSGKKLKILEMLDLPGFGVGIFIKRSCVQISGEGNHLDILVDFPGMESVIFSFQSMLEACNDISKIKSWVEKSSDYFYRFFLSNFIFGIRTGFGGGNLYSTNVFEVTNGFDSSNQGASATITEEWKPEINASDHALDVCHLRNTRSSKEALSCCLLVDIQLGEISMLGYGKRRLPVSRQSNKLEISIHSCRELHTVDWNIQGGNIYLESLALSMFAHCFQAYFLLISKHPSVLSVNSRESFGEAQLSIEKPNNFFSEEHVLSTPTASLSETGMTFNLIFLRDFDVHFSQFAICLAGNGGSEDETQELILEIDMRLKHLTSERKLSFDLHRLSIFTQRLHKCISHKSIDRPMPHFRPSTLVASSSQGRSGIRNFPSQGTESVPSPLDVQSTNSPAFAEDLVEDDASGSSYHVSYILEHMAASIMIEKIISATEVGFLLLKSDWVGTGSISGVDLTMTLYEIKTISSLLASLSGMFSSKGSQGIVKRNVASRTQEGITDPDHKIPDGAIVAIKDLHEHMYFAVEAVDDKYRVIGVLHYTLVGKRALFRVKYHKGWRSQPSQISLISLFAKDNEGEPLRLNYSPGSGFVEISSNDDKRKALWQRFPFESNSFDSFEDDDEVKSYNRAAGRAFHLVNRKNNCGVAFVDGRPEFVKKPGNPLKAKVLNEVANDRRLNVSSDSSIVISNSKVQEESSHIGKGRSGSGSELPHVNITINKVSLTIFHEFSVTNGKIPIICGSINDVSIVGQITSSKFRIISSFFVAIQYMDARRNVWRDIISPVGSSLFFRSRFRFLDINNAYQGVPAHLFFTMRQVDLSLTEIVVDILLYLIGELNISGPYAVRTSMIFPNCCKLENYSGLDLLCHFPDTHDVKLAGQQSASIFLRHVATVIHHPESESLVSICLSQQGLFSTSPINVSLSNGCFFAWRTRAISLHDSRNVPGPFIVVEVSHKTEEGLCLRVSPLIRISNESGFSMELCFRRPQETGEYATILLGSGGTIDDSMASFDALELSGGSKRALVSLTLGNFLVSARPEITENIETIGESVSVEWSGDLEGGKALCMSGVFDQLNYTFRKAFGVKSLKSSFSILCCPVLVEGRRFTDLYFLVQTIGRDVPVMQPPNMHDTSEVVFSPVALQVQKEIFIYPTIQVYNFLQPEILVHVTENHPDKCMTKDYYMGKQATIPCGSSAFLYANPANMYFTVTLTAYSSRCKPASSAEWVKKLQKQKSENHYFDMDLDFGGGKYFAFLRLSRSDKGFLEAVIFSPYTFQNNTDFPLFCFAANQKPLQWVELQKYSSNLPPELGCLLPPKSSVSWFLKSSKIHLKGLEEKGLMSVVDLDILSGFTEICLEAQDDIGFSRMTKLGVSLQPFVQKAHVPTQIVCIVPRYIIANESKEPIFIRQCYLQDNLDEITQVDVQRSVPLQTRKMIHKRQDISILDSVLKRQRNLNENSQVFIQFRLKDVGFSWSGPVCVASLGCFFLKFKRSLATLSDQSDSSLKEKRSTVFARIQAVEECSSLILHFYMPVNAALPYRIENCLRGTPLMYHQKDSVESDTVTPGDSVDYVWDDINLPHKLIVQVIDFHLVREINIDKICSWKPLFKMRQQKGMVIHFINLPHKLIVQVIDFHLVREINIDKICSWKPLFKMRQQKGMVIHFPSVTGFRVEKRTEELHGLEVFKLGYQVYANGPTRVLRICERADSYKEEKVLQPCISFQFKISNFAIHLFEKSKQDVDESELPTCSTFLVARLANIALDSLVTDQLRYYFIGIQMLNIDEKWQGAPFASMIRRSQMHDSGSNENILQIVFVLKSSNSNVKEVKYSSIILQPIDLKVDEETLMKLIAFWRRSLSTSRAQSQQFYFKHFEIHPIKITASFLPGNPYSSYSSAQETLRSLLHSVIKVPAVNNKIVELNGILLTHAFVTSRELLIKCAQHYSWYIVRAIYIAKGSPLLPPAFASIFDDTASSSLDVFFDPSDGSISLPGLTLGTFKFISKCIDSKGFSGTKRYFGDLGKIIRIAGSNVIFAAVTEISDSILKGAEASGFNGMVNGFHQGILRLAMEPSLLGAAVLEGGPDRKIKLDRSPGVDELYIEGYLQAMLDVMYKQEYLRVRVIDNLVVLKNLPPNSFVINEIVENVRSFLISKALLKGDPSMVSRPLRHLRTESEWRIGPTVLTLCEHLFVSFTIRMMRKHADRFTIGIKWNWNARDGGDASSDGSQQNSSKKWAVGKFVFSGMIAYLDGRLCRHIPNPIARRIVSGFLLSYLDNKQG